MKKLFCMSVIFIGLNLSKGFSSDPHLIEYYNDKSFSSDGQEEACPVTFSQNLELDKCRECLLLANNSLREKEEQRAECERKINRYKQMTEIDEKLNFDEIKDLVIKEYKNYNEHIQFLKSLDNQTEEDKKDRIFSYMEEQNISDHFVSICLYLLEFKTLIESYEILDSSVKDLNNHIISLKDHIKNEKFQDALKLDKQFWEEDFFHNLNEVDSEIKELSVHVESEKRWRKRLLRAIQKLQFKKFQRAECERKINHYKQMTEIDEKLNFDALKDLVIKEYKNYNEHILFLESLDNQTEEDKKDKIFSYMEEQNISNQFMSICFHLLEFKTLIESYEILDSSVKNLRDHIEFLLQYKAS